MASTDRGSSILLLGAAMLALLACSPGSETARAAESISHRACACTDNACARAAADELEALLQKRGAAPLAEANATRVKQAAREATVCVARLGVGAPAGSASSSASR